MHPSTWPAPVPRYEPPQHLVSPPPVSTTRHGAVVAGYGIRAIGHLIDSAVVLGAVGAVAIGLDGHPGRPAAPAALVLLLVLAVWFGLAVVVPLLVGGTIGQVLVGLRMVGHDDGEPLGLGRAAARWGLTMALRLVPGGMLLSLLWPLRDSRRATLHDLGAGTAVVRRRR